MDRPICSNPRFVGFIIVGCLGFGLVHRFVPALVQITAIAAMVVVLACLVAAALEKQAESQRHIELMFEQLEIPLCLAPEHQHYDEYRGRDPPLSSAEPD